MRLPGFRALGCIRLPRPSSYPLLGPKYLYTIRAHIFPIKGTRRVLLGSCLYTVEGFKGGVSGCLGLGFRVYAVS